MTKRMLFIIISAGICFLLFPLRFSLIKPEANNTIFQFFFQFLSKVDSPYNQAPSLHVAFALLFWTVFRNLKSYWRALAAFWLLLLALSTITTYQHHFIDIICGAILAQISFIIFPFQKNNFQLRNFQVANYYFLVGWITVLLVLILNQFHAHFWLILVWIVLVIFMIGYQYQKNNIHFLKDRYGNIPFYKKVFYFPYRAIYWFFWKFLRKYTKPTRILPGLFISSKLDKTEIQDFDFNEKTFVYDLSAELEENDVIKEKSQYFCVPFLDIGSFELIVTKKLVLQITTNYTQLPAGGKILIHCTMGFTRSAVIGILVVKKILSLPLEEAIIIVTKANKHTVIQKYLQDFLKTNNL
ncbi:phosphatase PAP2 family protein [Chryseobacterium sp. SNU WT5]|uniref:phosphatase PAP2 family protein n=1 Tax=Chryseobacterium sp. SNU WT5 TaxID=2594269 RepID=UPI0021CF7061|nr:phosphatase PAP2 family protein [Chryseobacterium sp. SNU WT5]